MKAVFKTTGGKDPVQGSLAAYAAGETIFSQGDLGTEMFIIQEGEVHIVKHINNESHLLSRLEKGDFFGEMALLESVPRTADAVAHTEVKALIINGALYAPNAVIQFSQTSSAQSIASVVALGVDFQQTAVGNIGPQPKALAVNDVIQIGNVQLKVIV